MSSVGAFIHLYHVWGLFGLLTAILYGRAAYRRWLADDGNWGDAPVEWAKLFVHHFKLLTQDIWMVLKLAFARFIGVDVLWVDEPRSPWRYASDHTLMFGIMLGGLSRFLMAFYWAESNREWMNEQSVVIPSIILLFAIIGDLSHQSSAWPKLKYRVRLLLLAAVVWIYLGANFNG